MSHFWVETCKESFIYLFFWFYVWNFLEEKRKKKKKKWDPFFKKK